MPPGGKSNPRVPKVEIQERTLTLGSTLSFNTDPARALLSQMLFQGVLIMMMDPRTMKILFFYQRSILFRQTNGFLDIAFYELRDQLQSWWGVKNQKNY